MAPDPNLHVRIENPLPSQLPTGRATAVFCYGSCYHRREAIADFAIVADGVRHRPTAMRMPRLDVFETQPRGYRSGFWATVPIPAHEQTGSVELSASVRLANGAETIVHVGRIEVVEPEPPPPAPEAPLAICMATHEPDLELFRTQVDSLRAQTYEHWVCVISDDCSSPEKFAEIRHVVDRDPRFVASRSPRRLGFYRNFERALAMAPAGAELIALSDQDDRWFPEKLEVLRASLGGAGLVYSDMRLVTRSGRVLRDTLWRRRRNNPTNIASMLIANSATGAAMLLRREVVDAALPFPEPPGLQFHDHWLGLVAMATGDVAYVDRPLYDYVQHAGAVLGKVRRGGRARAGVRESLRGWRTAYFWGYLGREVQAHVLLARVPSRITRRKRRALELFIASGRSPLAFAWLALRPLRRLVGLNDTLGSEVELAQGIAWRWLVALRSIGLDAPGRRSPDTSYPLGRTFEQKRLRRWRERI